MNNIDEIIIQDARKALIRIVEGLKGKGDLEEVFAGWLLNGSDFGLGLEFIGEVSSTRSGASRSYSDIAILGFCADANVKEDIISALKEGLEWLVGRSTTVQGISTGLLQDPIALLGVAVGTKAVSDSNLMDMVSKWVGDFITEAYKMRGTENWQKCLIAAAAKIVGVDIPNPVPQDDSISDVLIALETKSIFLLDDKSDSKILALQYLRSTKSIEVEPARAALSLTACNILMNHRSEISDNSAFSSNLTLEEILQKNLPTAVILTAINDEYSAVRNHLKEVFEVDRNDTSYEVGIFEFAGKEVAKVFIRECGAKNMIASQESERAIQYFKPAIMMFVGIAGSRKPNDFAIGDVIFPEKVYSYEGGKSEKESFSARPDLADMTYTLKEIAKKERRKNDWKVLIKGNWDQEIQADLGVIASGEKVIEHYHSGIGKIITEHYNDTSAVEMEGFGFAKAANRQGRETSNILIGVVRGISDILEQPSKKKKPVNDDRRPANAKKIASDTAAAFAFWLILKANQTNLEW